MFALFLALTLAKTYAPPPSDQDMFEVRLGCRTQCGLHAPFETDCTALQKFETSVLDGFASRVRGWPKAEMCSALNNWTLLVDMNANADGVWQASSNNTHKLLGLVIEEQHIIIVGKNRWGDSSLAHEMSHVFSLAIDHKAGHAGWKERGIVRAINAVSDHFHNDYADPGMSWIQK